MKFKVGDWVIVKPTDDPRGVTAPGSFGKIKSFINGMIQITFFKTTGKNKSEPKENFLLRESELDFCKKYYTKLGKLIYEYKKD